METVNEEKSVRILVKNKFLNLNFKFIDEVGSGNKHRDIWYSYQKSIVNVYINNKTQKVLFFNCSNPWNSSQIEWLRGIWNFKGENDDK